MMRWLSLILLSVGLAFAVAAQTSTNDDADTRTKAISKTLRCVVCQNQSIADSNAELAIDMRKLVRKRVEAGDSDEQVRDYMRERYGDYILMKPPFQMSTMFLWLGPFVVIGLFAVWLFSRTRVRQGVMAANIGLSEEEQAKVDAALSDHDGDAT